MMKRSASVAINRVQTSSTESQPGKATTSSATSSFTTARPSRHNDGRHPNNAPQINNRKSSTEDGTDKSRRETNREKRGKRHAGRVTVRIGDAAHHFWHRLFPRHKSDKIGRGGPSKPSKLQQQNERAKWRGMHLPTVESMGQRNGGRPNIQSIERRGGATDKILPTYDLRKVEPHNTANATIPVTNIKKASQAPSSSHPSVPLYPLLACILLYCALRRMFSFKRRDKISRITQAILPGGKRLVVSQKELAEQIQSLRPSNRGGTITPPSLARDRMPRTPSENGEGTPKSNGVSDQQTFLNWMEQQEELHLARVKCEQLTADAVCANVRAEILAEQLKAMKEKGHEKQDGGDDDTVVDLPNSRSIDGVTDQASFLQWMKEKENLQIALSRLDELTSDAVCAQELAEMAREELDVLKHENVTIKDEKDALARTLEKESALHSQAIEEAAIVSEENSLLKDKVISLESENIFLDNEMERLMNELRNAAPPEVADVHEGETLEYKSNESESIIDSLTEDLGEEEAIDIHMEAKVTALQAAIDEMTSCHNAEKNELKMSISELEANGDTLTRQFDAAMRKIADLTCDNERLKEEVGTLLEKAEETGEVDTQTAAIDSELMDELLKLRTELSMAQDAIQPETDQGLVQCSESQGEHASCIEEDMGRLVQERSDLSLELTSVNNTLSMVQAENAKLSEEIRASKIAVSSSADISFDLPRAFEIESHDELKEVNKYLEQGLSTVNVQLTKAYHGLMELMKSMEATIEAQGCKVPTLTAECLEPYTSSEKSLQENAMSQAAALVEQVSALQCLQEGQIKAFRPAVGPGIEVLALQSKSSSDSDRFSAVNTTASGSIRSECTERSSSDLNLYESPQGAKALSNRRKKTPSLKRLWKKNTKGKSDASHN